MAGVKPYEDWQVRMCIVMEAQVSGDESSKISIYDAQRVTSKQRIEVRACEDAARACHVHACLQIPPSL